MFVLCSQRKGDCHQLLDGGALKHSSENPEKLKKISKNRVIGTSSVVAISRRTTRSNISLISTHTLPDRQARRNACEKSLLFYLHLSIFYFKKYEDDFFHRIFVMILIDC